MPTSARNTACIINWVDVGIDPYKVYDKPEFEEIENWAGNK